MAPDKTLLRYEVFEASSRIKWQVISVLIFSVFFLTGCDPCNPMGIREMGIGLEEIYSSEVVIAFEYRWGPCGSQYYQGLDGGLTWSRLEHDSWAAYTDFKQTNVISGDCTQSCEFIDAQNTQIHYRILPGKYLLRSLDGGETWREELNIPDWSRMEKNYVISQFLDIGPTPKDLRGPFGAVTDPNTGNLIVAMGFEGVLVGSKDGQWTWVKLGDYEQIHPSRFDMLSLIPVQNWLMGLLIATLSILFGLYKSGYKGYRRSGIFMMVLGFLIIPIPLNLLILLLMELMGVPVSSEFSTIFRDQTSCLSGPWILILVISGLTGLIMINLKNAWMENRPLTLKILALSASSALIYWLALISWSQGIFFSDLFFANLVSFAFFAGGLIFMYLFARSSRTSTFLNQSRDHIATE